MSRRAEQDERDTVGEMTLDVAERIAGQEATRAARTLEAVQAVRERERAVAAREAAVAALETRQQGLEAAIATRERQAQQSHERTVADRGAEIGRLDAVIAAKAEEARRATAQADQAQARSKHWVEVAALLEPASA